jgi:hypothetical protein
VSESATARARGVSRALAGTWVSGLLFRRVVAWIAKPTLLALCLAGWSGCFFSPRDPKGTAGFDSTLTRWRTPSTPGILLSNVRVTFEDRQDAFYGRSIADSFRFVPDPQDSSDFATQGRMPYEGWNGAVEKDVAFLIFSSSDSIRLEFTDLSPPDSTTLADTVRVRKNYALRIYTRVGEGQVVSSNYDGTATFFMNDLPAGWTLTRWQDTRGGMFQSWGRLRGDARPET